MSHFPPEILISIFKHLHLKQKLECMLVCHAWAQVLLQGYLFEAIHFSNSLPSSKPFEQNLDSLLKKAKSGSFPGKKCKKFLVNGMGHASINATLLATSFPNLNLFYSRIKLLYEPGARCLRSTTIESDPFSGWRNNLKTFIDEGFNQDTLSNILKTGVFSSLTTLKVRYFPSQSIPQLRNAPALNNLWIGLYDVSPALIEDLHRALPELTSLTLIGMFSENRSQAVLLNVAPAEKIKALRLICGNGTSHVVNQFSDAFLSYFKMKYTHLNEFICGTSTCTTSNRILSMFSDSLLSDFMSTVGPDLTKCVVKLQKQSAETFNLMGKDMPQLECLGVDFYDCLDLFQRLKLYQANGYGCPALLKDLRNFNLIEFKRFTQLKELILDFSTKAKKNDYYYNSTLGEILEKIPQTVRTLSLKAADIVVDQEKELSKECSGILNLKLYCVNIKGKDFSNQLAHYFPKLTSLILDSCNFQYDFTTRSYTDAIELPDHHLDYAEFTPHHHSACIARNLTHFTVTASGQSHYYEVPMLGVSSYYISEKILVDNQDRSIQKVLKESPRTDNHSKTFRFKCASVDTFYCSGYLLLL